MGIRNEYINFVRHREDGGLNSVTSGMFLLGAGMFINVQIVWNLSVIFGFDLDPNSYAFFERAGYILMGARPVQEGARYIGGHIRRFRGKTARLTAEQDANGYTHSPGANPPQTAPNSPALEPLNLQPRRRTNQSVPVDPRDVKGRWIALLDGTLIPLADWQKRYTLPDNRVGKYFSLTENKWNYPNFVISEGVIRLLDTAREIRGSAIHATSLYRPGDNGSAHGFGLAVDVQVQKKATGRHDSQGRPEMEIVRADGEQLAKELQEAAKKLGYKIRIAWFSYWAKGLGCIHVDVAPMYFNGGNKYLALKVAAEIIRKFKKEMVNGW